MKTITIILILLFSTNVYAQYIPWDDHPNNWKNSEHNWKNSPNNWKNNSNNWENSKYNPNAKHVYDNNGSISGYVPKNQSGVVNFYDYNGNRTGYTTTHSNSVPTKYLGY